MHNFLFYCLYCCKLLFIMFLNEKTIFLATSKLRFALINIYVIRIIVFLPRAIHYLLQHFRVDYSIQAEIRPSNSNLTNHDRSLTTFHINSIA